MARMGRGGRRLDPLSPRVSTIVPTSHDVADCAGGTLGAKRPQPRPIAGDMPRMTTRCALTSLVMVLAACADAGSTDGPPLGDSAVAAQSHTLPHLIVTPDETVLDPETPYLEAHAPLELYTGKHHYRLDLGDYATFDAVQQALQQSGEVVEVADCDAYTELYLSVHHPEHNAPEMELDAAQQAKLSAEFCQSMSDLARTGEAELEGGRAAFVQPFSHYVFPQEALASGPQAVMEHVGHNEGLESAYWVTSFSFQTQDNPDAEPQHFLEDGRVQVRPATELAHPYVQGGVQRAEGTTELKLYEDRPLTLAEASETLTGDLITDFSTQAMHEYRELVLSSDGEARGFAVRMTNREHLRCASVALTALLNSLDALVDIDCSTHVDNTAETAL